MNFAPQKLDLDWLIARPITHRGLHDGSYVENTESAFAAAIAKDYAIECDVQLTSDGEALVFHDDSVERLLDGVGTVRSLTAKQVRKMAFRYGTDKVQTLSELLEQVNGRVTLVVEIKTLWDKNVELAQRCLDVTQNYKGPCALMSYDSVLIKHLADTRPNAIRGIVGEQLADDTYKDLPPAENYSLRRLLHLPETQPHFLSYYFRDLPCEPVANYRAAGNPVITFTIRDKEQETYARQFCDQVTFEGFLPA